MKEKLMSSPTDEWYLLTFSFQKESDGRWTAYCNELGTATFADTLEEAKDELTELVQLHLSTLEDVGERQRFFAERNILPHNTSERYATLAVPVDMIGTKPERLYEPYRFSFSHS